MPAEQAATAIAHGLSATLNGVHMAAGALQTAEEPHAFWASLLSGRGQVSQGG